MFYEGRLWSEKVEMRYTCDELHIVDGKVASGIVIRQ